MAVALAPRVSLLDGFTLHLDGTGHLMAAAEVPRGVQRLIAHVSLYRRRPRTLVAGHLWPNVPEENAHGSLRSALWRLQQIAPGVVSATGDCLALAGGVRVDVQEVENWASRTRDRQASIDDFRVPTGALRGDLLPGWYDEWVLMERERLRQVTLQTLEEAAGRLAAAGCTGEALEAAYAAVRLEPLRESAHRVLVRVHLAEGNPSEALRAYRCFRDLLGDELRLAPTAKMTALVSDLLLPRRTVTSTPPSHRLLASS
jgi:DNA-binding SARP family transcriptional activator